MSKEHLLRSSIMLGVVAVDSKQKTCHEFTCILKPIFTKIAIFWPVARQKLNAFTFTCGCLQGRLSGNAA
jgi:hypothetical protein